MWLLTLGVLVGCLGTLVVRGYRNAFAGKYLPKPGPPPETRAEAVRRVLKHLARKSIGELEEGTAAVIVGTVYPIAGIAPLRSPATDTACLGYHLEVRDSRLDANLRFRQLYDEARCVAIEVRDDTGTVRVNPTGLELAITHFPAELHHPPHPPWLAARVSPFHRFVAVTIEEGLVQPGSRILVCGLVARELDATDYRDGKPALVFRASATFPLVASSNPNLFTPTTRPIAPEELRPPRG